jgi:hypothetical protein
MISIAITAEAYRAVRATLPEGALWPPQPFPGSDGLVRIWLDPAVVNRLGALRDRGESYSDVILRLARG